MSAGIWKSFDEIADLEKEYDIFEPKIDPERRDKIIKRWEKALKAVLNVD